MEIKKNKMPDGWLIIRFEDQCGVKGYIEENPVGSPLTIGIEGDEESGINEIDLDQEQIQALLPYLQAFAETGQLEPQEPTLQGGDERINAIAKSSAKRVLEIIETQNNELATMQEAGVAMAANIVEQGKRIQALEQLVKEWRELYETGEGAGLDETQKKTAQLLGE